MNLREKVVKGFAWSAVEKWGTQALSFLVFLILARLLDPEAFGLVAMASVFTSFVGMLVDQGLAEAVIQRPDLEPGHLDTAFWVNLLTGGLLTLVGMLGAGIVANIFDEPQLAPIVTWLSFSFILSALSSTQQAILRREMNFRSLAIRTLIARICGGVVGVGAAWLGFGVWSLVAQTLINSLVGVIALWHISDWWPKFRFSKEYFWELFTFGGNILAGRIMSFFNTRFDDFLIGYFLGSVALGYYKVAYSLLRRLIDLLANVSTSVAFPAFSQLQREPERLRQAFYEATQYTSLLSFPLFLGVGVLASELIVVLFGAKWEPSVPVMQILTFVGIIHSVLYFNGALVQALGKPGWLLWVKFLGTGFRAIAFILVAKQGIIAVALAYAISTYIIGPFHLWMTHRLVHLNFRKYFGQFVIPVLGSLAMVTVVLGLKYALRKMSSPYGKLAIYGVGATVVYSAVVWLLNPKLFRRLFELTHLIFPYRCFEKLERLLKL